MNTTTFDRARTNVAHPFLVMMGLYLGTFIGMFSETSLNIALPILSQSFAVDTSLMQYKDRNNIQDKKQKQPKIKY